MKYISTLVLVISLAFSSNLYSQESETFMIVKNESISDVTPYITALEKCNLDQYRLASKRRVLQFESGVTVRLFSGQELEAKGVSYAKEKMCAENTPTLHTAVFKLTDKGNVLELHEAKGKRYNFENKQ